MKLIITSIIYLASLLALSVFVFDRTNLYYELFWLDIPMHILGGLGVAALTLSVLRYQGKKVSLRAIIVAYFVVAFFWEIYEFIKDVSFNDQTNGIVDTVADTVNGLIGAIIAFFIFKK